MTTAEKIKEALANSYELSRAELAIRTGLTRDQVRWALPALLKAGEVERNIDDNGVEWLTEGGRGAVTAVPKREEVEEVEVPERVEPSQGSYKEETLEAHISKANSQDKYTNETFDAYATGFSAGYESAWRDIEDKLGAKIRGWLGVNLRSDSDE